ncbi:hypothetical protein EV182_002334, partial [Spiromyces aspiralis]
MASPIFEEFKPGQNVLLIAQVGQDYTQMQQYRDRLLSAVSAGGGQVDFEQLDRVNLGLVEVASAKYDHVVVSPVQPQGL